MQLRSVEAFRAQNSGYNTDHTDGCEAYREPSGSSWRVRGPLLEAASPPGGTLTRGSLGSVTHLLSLHTSV